MSIADAASDKQEPSLLSSTTSPLSKHLEMEKGLYIVKKRYTDKDNETPLT